MSNVCEQLIEALAQPSVIGEWSGPLKYRDPKELQDGEKVVVTDMLEGQSVIIGWHKDYGSFCHSDGVQDCGEEWFTLAHLASGVGLTTLLPELAEQLVCDGIVLYCLIPNDKELPSRLYLCDVALWNNEAVLAPIFGDGCVKSGLHLQPWDVLLRCAADLSLPTEPEIYIGQYSDWLDGVLNAERPISCAPSVRQYAFGLSVRSYDELHHEDGGLRYVRNYYKGV